MLLSRGHWLRPLTVLKMGVLYLHVAGAWFARVHARAQVAHNIGIVRVALFVLVPALLSLLVMMMCALQPLTAYSPLPGQVRCLHGAVSRG